MQIAITGATGLLGANLAEACLAAGHSVVATRRASSRVDHLADLDVAWVEASLADPEALARAFDGADAVFHCAASTSILPHPTPDLVAANVDGTRHVLEAVARAGVRRLVHTSSTVAIGVSQDGSPCTEESRWNLPERGLADGYAITKRDSEGLVLDAVRDGRLDAVVVNPGFLLGPRDVRPSSGTMILEVASGRAVVASPGRNCFVDVRDVADGMLRALASGRAGERYILGHANLSYREVFSLIADVVGKAPPRFVAPRPVAAVAGWLGDAVQALTGREQAITSNTVAWGFEPGFVFSSDKARTELGYAPRPVEQGIAAAWAWFREHGMA